MKEYSFLDIGNMAAEAEFNQFVKAHPRGSFMQTTIWARIKDTWGARGVIIRGEGGAIRASMLVLIRKMPFFGTTLLYAPRGPVIDEGDGEAAAILTEAVKTVAKEEKAYIFKCDPDILASDEEYDKIMQSIGYKHFTAGFDFDTIQPRFNYRLYLDGRGEDEVFESFHKKTRYNTRLAGRKGVYVEICGKEGLADFVRLMKITGQRDGFSVRSAGYFAKILDEMGEYARLYLAFFEGVAIAGAITTNFGGKVCYLYGASDNEQRNLMPNYPMQWEMIKWAIETGASVYDFQGVAGDTDNEENPLYGLYRFKSGFGGQVDELLGEYHLCFMPTRNFLIEKAISFREFLLNLRKS